jgi:hypothetical protein
VSIAAVAFVCVIAQISQACFRRNNGASPFHSEYLVEKLLNLITTVAL